MGALAGVKIEKLQGGLGRKNPSTDAHFGLVAVVTDPSTVPIVMNLGKGLVITSVLQAEEIGLTESVCVNAGDSWYEQITEFFRLAPEGTLYLFNGTTDEQISNFLKNNQSIKGFAISGASADLGTLSPRMQAIINSLAEENRLIDFCVIGAKGYTTSIEYSPIEQSEPNVSVLVAASSGSSYPALGAFLGMLAVRSVNENAGSVDIKSKPLHKRGTADYTLTDTILGLWLDAKLTGGQYVSQLTSAQIQDLNDKGILFAASYQGYPGVFFTNSRTCISPSSDYAFIENNRVWNKAARLLRIALLPEVKGVVKKDPSTGYIKSTTVSRWMSIANKSLEQMVVDDEISGFEVAIDPAQVVNGSAPVKIGAKVVMDGIVHEFEVALGLTNSIN